MMGTQSGSVISVTRIAPSSTVLLSLAARSLRTRPAAIALPMLKPVSKRRSVCWSVYVLMAPEPRSEWTVSGRCLHDVERSSLALLGPFDIHRTAVMGLNGPTPARCTKTRSLSTRRWCMRWGFTGLFTIGGLTGLFLASLGIDVQVLDTQVLDRPLHYIMVGGMVTAYIGGLHYWWPKMTGRMYSEMWGRVAPVVIFFGFNLTFFPQYILG
jgi:hypothetical protein